MLLLPADVLFKNLPRHMLGYSVGLIAELLVRVLTNHTVLDDISTLDDITVAAGRELQGRNGHQRKDHISTARPGEVLSLLNLHRQVHRGFHSGFPLPSGSF